jgi:predicted acylesterase/phospholipase RssA
LYGWTQTGQRPEFKLVTGISTGALIAPYAFLGPAYDEKLKTAYTTISTRDVARASKRPPWSSEALQDTGPLAELIARDLNQEMLADIANEHAQGKRLYIGTVNLDAQRFVVWNMGLIASSGHPRALQLFRDVMLASASIPGAFPPVYIDVELDGKPYDEMHVDGGTITQVFFCELVVDLGKVAEEAGLGAGSRNSSKVFVIRNGRTNPESQQVPRDVLTISGRALSTMIKSASINDMMRIQYLLQREGVDFRYTEIPADFEFEGKELFDPEEMQALFELGRGMTVDGTAWNRSPLDR